MSLDLRRALSIGYFVLALAAILSLAWKTPPFQAPDEPAHVFRSVQVGQGGLVGVRLEQGGGGYLPASVGAIARLFDGLSSRTPAVMSRRASCAAKTTSWRSPRTPIVFWNTAINPPVFYVPQALAIDLARLAHAPVVASVLYARIAGGVTAASLSAVAIAIADTGALPLAALLSLPMSVDLFASCTQDALLIAVTSLVAACLSRRPVALRSRGWILLSLGLGSIAAARPPYAPFLLVPVFLAEHGPQRRAASFAAAGACALLIGWIVFGAIGSMPNTRGGGSLFGGAQMHRLIGHPQALPVGIYRMLVEQGADLIRDFVGVFGWLDIVMPSMVYPLIWVALLCSVLPATLTRDRASSLAPPRWLGVSLCLAAAILLLVTTQFFVWTRPGHDAIEGVQGRYLIPVALVSVVLVGNGQSQVVSAVFAALIVGGLLLADLTVVPGVVQRHFTVVACSSDAAQPGA